MTPMSSDDRGRGFDPEPWLALGVPGREAEAWLAQRIGPAEASRWRRAGVAVPIEAVRWKRAGVDARGVREWLYAGIDAREAVVWTELGFDASRARRHKRAGLTAAQAYGRERRAAPPAAPSWTGFAWRSGTRSTGLPTPARFVDAVRQRSPRVIHSYMQRGWTDDEAIAWALHDIDAGEALAWKELGLRPAEARRLHESGQTAMQTAKAWWEAGIPASEVADWIGAGLTPAEAAEQRAGGISAERAAILRSLRTDERPGA
jgi:hypothetical protein